jgi:1,4-alpha-glucan branching enzyme
MSEHDRYLWAEGTHRRLAGWLGAHPDPDPDRGTTFRVWAPNATSVSVIGDWNGWTAGDDPLDRSPDGQLWEGCARGARAGHVYKYSLTTRDGRVLEKSDPVAFASEVPPRTGSVVWDLDYQWQDEAWMATRDRRSDRHAPMSVYEVHLGSWLRDPARPDRLLGYRELTPLLVEHVLGLGFTHVELLPVMEHPFYGSWGYQMTGFFAPSSRYGTPQDLMAMVDALHQAGIGVILDWVPSHFPSDEFSLARFDGTSLYEHADPVRGVHPDWGSLLFNYGRNEVRSFLASSADHWLRTYHADGLRVDAVASMLYLDYSRKPGQWSPNRFGGREDLDAVHFLRQMNTGIAADHPDTQTTAEESTAWPGVSQPVDAGGLGFDFKWDLGWMHDTLSYLAEDPIHRKYHHGELTFRSVYASSEHFVVPLSHDEVVHGKGSLLAKMPGDEWQKFATLRLLYGYQFAVPGKKLLFMGAELAPWAEWNHDVGLDWGLLDHGSHAGVARWVTDLNRVYRSEPALHRLDTEPEGFSWLRHDDAETSILSFLRRDGEGREAVVVCNFTPVPRSNITLGVAWDGWWTEAVNSDAVEYGGSGVGNLGGVEAQPVPWHGWPRTITVTAPPLGCVILTGPGPSGSGGRGHGGHER